MPTIYKAITAYVAFAFVWAFAVDALANPVPTALMLVGLAVSFTLGWFASEERR